MANDLSKALSLLDKAETELNSIRTTTPRDYMDTEDGQGKVIGHLRQIDGDLLDASMRIGLQLSDADKEKWGPRFSYVFRVFEYVANEATSGRLPALKGSPWPPAEWVAEDNMRADAADAAAEPATNGYE